MTLSTQTIAATLTATMQELYSGCRKRAEQTLPAGVTKVQELLAEHPLLAQHDDFINGNYDWDGRELELKLYLPLLISLSYGFQLRINLVQDEDEARLDMWTEFIGFKDHAGFGSRSLETLDESRTASFELEEEVCVVAKALDNALRAQIKYMVDTLSDSSERLFAEQFKDVDRDMALERVVPLAFLELA